MAAKKKNKDEEEEERIDVLLADLKDEIHNCFIKHKDNQHPTKTAEDKEKENNDSKFKSAI